MNPEVISVSEFVKIINETLAFAYPQVIVEGEVSGFKLSQGKFVFFDLKDENTSLACFTMAYSLKLPLEDGMKVRVTGSPKVMPKSSKFSLTVREVELAGVGELLRAMKLLKDKLEKEGLFDPARKRPLPHFPARIGLITSGTSAAYHDFMKILGARWGGVEVSLADVSVQGQQAPDQVVAAISYFNGLPQPVDVLVLIRGGGSLEDLIAFSTEPVARAVATSRTPIVVGVGHEVDVSLADYAADVRAATPTDAARLVVPDRREITARIDHLLHRSESRLATAIQTRQARVDQAMGRLEGYLRRPREHVQSGEAKLWRALDRLQHLGHRTADRTAVLENRLASLQQALIRERNNRVENAQRLLHGFDPQAVLGRGYAIVRNTSGGILRNAAAVAPGTDLNVQLAKGSLGAKVTGTHQSNAEIQGT